MNQTKFDYHIQMVGNSFSFEFMWQIAPFMWMYLQRELRGCKTVLDLGCGKHSPLSMFNTDFERITGIDIHMPALKEAIERKTHHELYEGDIRNVEEMFAPKSFDAVIAIDVIEHFSKLEGRNLIASMEKLAKKRIVIYTPNGFIPQDAVGDNPNQFHLSGWEINELKEMGFKIYGMNGFKWLRGEGGYIKYKPKFPFWLVSSFSQYLVYHYPKYASGLLAIKEIQ